ncbi:hypothetical protein PG993_008554 [Apiospora rasikravindrae]|uniref:Clr5 domain-containing protein n=1 Tax=Apiospora rasikravindrae TaxID=990691 RepID=A0ABR1T339_9PEZI
MAKSASDSDPDSKPVSSLFWRSVLNADEPRSSPVLRAGTGDVKSEDATKPPREEGEDEAERFAKRPITASVKHETRAEDAGSYDTRYGRPPPPMQQPSHHPMLLPTGPAAVPSAAASSSRRPIQQYPAEVWETHKTHLYHLYIQQGKSLKQIQQIMAQRGFNASDKMYKDRFSKWGFRKNRRASTREKAEAHQGNSSIMHANQYRGSSRGSMRAAGMMHEPDCYAQYLGTATTTPRDYRQKQVGLPAGQSLPLAYFQDALYDNRPQLPDTYLVQDQLLRCFDGMAARAWATGEVRPGDANKIMYVTPEVHRNLVRLFDVNDYISTMTDEPPHCRSAVMRPGYESVSTFLKNPSLFGLLRLLQLTMYAGPNTQLPVVWRYIANSPQLRHCSVPGLYELCQNMSRLIGSYPPGSRGASPFVDLVINTLPRLEAMVPPPASDGQPWTPERKLRHMLRRLLLATSHRQSLSEPLKRYTYNSELLVRELLEVLDRENGGPVHWHVCDDISGALPKEIRLDLAIFHGFKKADENGNWWQDADSYLDGLREIEREEGRKGEPPMDDLQRRLLLIIQANIHESLWEMEREKRRQKPRLFNTTPEENNMREEIVPTPWPSTTNTNYLDGGGGSGKECNARLGLAIALRRQAMDYITGMEQREHGGAVRGPEGARGVVPQDGGRGGSGRGGAAERQGAREAPGHVDALNLLGEGGRRILCKGTTIPILISHLEKHLVPKSRRPCVGIVVIVKF